MSIAPPLPEGPAETTPAGAPGRELPWHPDPGLARLAFGTRAPRGASWTGTRHLAFLPTEALELDLADPVQRDFGDYELLEQIGQGGMGVVYRARQKRLERDVALKLLAAGPWASEEFVAGFRREARNAAGLQHPNIVAVHEMGEHEGLIFYAMRLVTGQSLAQRLHEGGPLPPHEAAALLRTVAEAVDHAHRLGVLHLDIKPGNILLDEQGAAQVTDFGLARRLGQAPSLENEQVSGTPSYMAPEQARIRSERLSPATDIWGIGAVLYEALTGMPPFLGDTPEATLRLVLDGTVRAPDRYARIPPDLQAICLKCLSKPPHARYPSARALADDLGRFLEHRSVQARPLNAVQRAMRWARREPRFAAASGLAALALVAGMAATTHQWQRADSSAAAARAQTWATRGEAAWRLLADGRDVDAAPLLLENLREREAHGDAAGAALERLRLGTLHATGAQLIDVAAIGAPGRALAVSADGSRVAVADLDEVIHLVDVADGRTLWRSDVRAAAGFRAVGLPLSRLDFSPDGRWLLSATLEPPTFLRPHGRNNVLVDARTGRVVAPPPRVFPGFTDATFSADGSHALLRARDGAIQVFEVAGWRPAGPRRTATSMGGSWQLGDAGRYVARGTQDGIEVLGSNLTVRHAARFPSSQRLAFWATQPAGDQLALGHADGTVRLLDTRTLALRTPSPAPSETLEALGFSADGQWLVASAGGRIFLWDVATGSGGVLPGGRPLHASRLQADTAGGTVFAFGPDDALLWQLPAAAGDGHALPRRIAGARPLVSQFGFGANLPRNAAAYAPRAALAANIERNGEVRLWRWRSFAPLPAMAPGRPPSILAFDGRHVLATVPGGIRAMALDGAPASPVLAHPQPVAWAAFLPDFTGVVTASGRELWVFDRRSGRPRFAPVVLGNSPQLLETSPDGRWLVATHAGEHAGRRVEFATAIDLASGAAVARDVPLPSPVEGLRFSPDGRHLVHWRYGEAWVRRTADLRAIGRAHRFGADIAAIRAAGAEPTPAHTPVRDAALGDGSWPALSVILDGLEPVRPQWIELDSRDGRRRYAQPVRPGWTSPLLPTPGGQFELLAWGPHPGSAHRLLGDGRQLPLPHAPGPLGHAHAASADGRWIATVSAGGVLLADRASGEWASAVLPLQLPAGDTPARLAFAPRGDGLLARSHGGRWVYWPLLPNAAPVADLLQRQQRVRADQLADHTAVAAPLPAALRAALRREDPGAPGVRGRAPRVGNASPQAMAMAPPQARPGLLPIDLHAAYNRPLADPDALPYDLPGALSSIPGGRQRLLGIDFDIHGLVVLRMPDTPQPVAFPVESALVPLGPVRIAALHLLLAGCCPLPVHPEGAYAYVDLHYEDGGKSRLPVLNRRHVRPLGEDPGDRRPERVAWRGRASDGQDVRVFAPRLRNPHPHRMVTGLRFLASEHFASGPLVFAATAELAGASPAAAPATTAP